MILQSIKMALKAIISNKMRSFLTMLGIIIGVFSLVVLVSLVNGATGFVTDSISDLGGNYLEINTNPNKAKPLDNQDLKQIEEIPQIHEIAPYSSSPCSLIGVKEEKSGSVYGVTSAYMRIMGLKVQYGRNLSAVDEDNHIRVAVITLETAQRLYNKSNVVGENVTINGLNYKVIGVLEKMSGFISILYGADNTVYIPLSCFSRESSFSYKGISRLLVSTKEGANIEEAKIKLTEFMLKQYDNNKDVFSILSQQATSDTLRDVTRVLALVFGGVAAISLIVGGIGIMNIMLVSVTERTKEIGIRKAIGATTRSILLQFLIEAFVISLTGCLIGLILAYGAVAAANAIVKALDFKMAFHVPIYIVFGSAAFSLLVGLVFGLYPANKAAKKKPIDALRYDG